MKIDLVTPLKALEANAEGRTSDFAQGYLMGIRHALELAEIWQFRIDHNLPQNPSAWHDVTTPEGKQYSDELDEAMLTPEARRQQEGK